MKLFQWGCLMVALGVVLGACRTELSPLAPLENPLISYIDVNAKFCTLPPKKVLIKFKYLFVVDRSALNQPVIPVPGISGSPAPDPSASPLPGQDPYGILRYAPIVSFVNTLQTDPSYAVPDYLNYTFLNLILFSEDAFVPTPLSDSSFISLSDNRFLDTIRSAWRGTGSVYNPRPIDAGKSNFNEAFVQSLAVIRNDLNTEIQNQTNAQTSSQNITKIKYQVIFISGAPPITTYPGNVIQSLVNATLYNPDYAPYLSGLTVSAAYYSPPVTQDNPHPLQYQGALDQLQLYASSTGGQFFQYTIPTDASYLTLVPPRPTLRYQLTDFFAENESAVWWNGNYLVDSDRDGLPDRVEVAQGSNPLLKDSDGNGVSDLVEYRTKGVAVSTPKDPYFICTNFLASQSGSGVSFIASSNDGLNDCEKYLFGNYSPEIFNIPGSFVPMLYALKNNLSIVAQAGPTTAGSVFADPYGDGMTNYQKLKGGLPLTSSMKSLVDFTQRDIQLEHLIQADPDIECYQATINHFAILGDNNWIKFHYIQNTSVMQDHPILKFAEQQVYGHSSPVIFRQDDFK